MTHAIQITTTTDTRQLAEEIARHLVEARLAACVQIDGPIESVYRWKEKVETATEWRCTIKSMSHQFAAVETAIQAIHSYDTPEIIATKIVDGSGDYLRWIVEQSEPSAQERESEDA